MFQTQLRIYCAVTLVLCISICVKGQNEDNELPTFPAFSEYLIKFNKTYNTTEYELREKIYEQNIQKIKALNRNELGVNFYADWSQQEFKQKKVSNLPSRPQSASGKSALKSSGIPTGAEGSTSKQKKHLTDDDDKNLPSSFDWRDKIQMKIKDQGKCGSCWAFSTAAFFQAQALIKGQNPNTIDFSEQYLVSCDTKSLGCEGGSIESATDLVLSRGGIPTQQTIPYKPFLDQQPQICSTDELFLTSKQENKRVSYYGLDDNQKIKQLILKKPVNIALCAQDFQFYSPSSNSYRKISCNRFNKVVDHTLLLIGYTETQWIIKNSWGNIWGMNGIGYVSRSQAFDCCIGTQFHITGALKEDCKDQNCLTCINQVYCTKCEEKYYLTYQEDSLSQNCQFCDLPNCVQCSNYFKDCMRCTEGYTLVIQIFLLNWCKATTIQNCKNTSNNKCYQCIQGYQLNPDNLSCKKCNSTSYFYSTNSSCLSNCPEGYYGLSILSNITSNILFNRCISCSEGCKKCALKNGSCLTCSDGYELIGSLLGVCVRKQRIQVTLKLNILFAQLGKYQIEIFRSLLGLLGSKYSSNSEYLIITSIKPGSVIIQSQLVVPPGQSTSQMFESIKSKLTSSNSLGTIPILSIDKLSAVSSNTMVSENKVQQGSTLSTGIIVGISIGAAAGLLLIAVIVYLVIKKVSNNEEKNPQDKTDSASQDPKYRNIDPNQKVENIQSQKNLIGNNEKQLNKDSSVKIVVPGYLW